MVFATTVNTGPLSTGASYTQTNLFLHMVIPLAGHEVEEIGDIYLNDKVVVFDAAGFATTAPYYGISNRSYVRVRKHLGAEDQEADDLLVAEVPGWSAAHRLQGIAYLYVRFEYHPDVFPLGIPNVAAVVKGKKIYDPRNGLTQWTRNAALCARDYMSEQYGFNCDDDEIDDTYYSAAANVCDEAVAIAGGSAARYTCDGVIDTATAPLDNLTSLMSSLAGVTTYVQGQFRLHAGAYDTPAGEITLDMLAGGLTIRGRTPRKELFNAVKGTYVDPDKNWQPTDFPAVTNATYEAEDNDEQIFKDIELPFTSRPERAQMLAKIALEKARQGIMVDLPVNHNALKYAAFDVVTLTNDQMGWTSKPFRIMRWNMGSDMVITLSLQEESSASYDWNSGEATVIDPAPDTNLPDPFFVDPPGTPQITESLYAPLDGSAVKSKATVTWGASPDAFLDQYQLEYKAAADTAYTVLTRTVATTFDVLDIAQGDYDFRVKAISTLGVSSAYASSAATMAGLTAPPAPIENFSLNAIHNNAHLSWDQSADIDVRVGGKIRLRYTPDTVSPSWSSAIDLGPAMPGVASQAVLPLMNGTYLIKAVDSSGNESTTASLIQSTVADIVKMNRIITRTESPDFPAIAGATRFEIIDGALQFAPASYFDDHPGLFDDQPGLFDGYGGFIGAGEYAFGLYGDTGDPIDLGKVTTARVTATVRADIYDASASFDEIEGDFDDQLGLFDGGDVTGIDVKLYIATSDDGVNFTDFRQFFVGDYTCRYIAFDLIARSATLDVTNLNVRISDLSVAVDVPDIFDSETLVTSAAGVTTVTFAQTFVVVPDIGVTIQGASVGDQEIVLNVTTTSFDIGVKNAAGSYVAKTASWVANGY